MYVASNNRDYVGMYVRILAIYCIASYGHKNFEWKNFYNFSLNTNLFL